MSEIRDCAVHEIRCNKCGQAILNEAAIQSIAERVCEVLAREVENEPMKRPKPEDAIMENPLKLQLFIGGFHAGVREVLDIITRPRDWAKELEDKK